MTEPLTDPALNLIALAVNEIARNDYRFSESALRIVALARHVDATIEAERTAHADTLAVLETVRNQRNGLRTRVEELEKLGR